MAFSTLLVAGISVLFLVMGFGSATGLYHLEIFGLSLAGEGAPFAAAILIVFGVVGVAFCFFPWIAVALGGKRRRKR